METFNYRWELADALFPKNRGKVFSCFACGGGSTMGYKLAGFDVIGINEIDPRMAELYQRNHNPKYAFIEGIQTFKSRTDLPPELYELDILDGSPPCSSFSMAGNREKDWGKEKKFKEGQAKQVLDTLFFDFIELAENLQPKIVVAENVSGILKGNARDYARKILTAFDKAGYLVQEFKLDSSQMEVPQKRERVFFIAVRKDLAELLPKPQGLLFCDFPRLNMNFAREPIPFEKIRTEGLNNANWTNHDQGIWEKRVYGDRTYSSVLERTENRSSNFNSSFIYPHKPVCTIASSEGSKLTLFDEPRRMNSIEMILSQSFPLDYDFGSDKCAKIQYVLGMSVPPIMMAHIANRIYNEWRTILNEA
ncbi:DNA cytosine methyltransferase [Flavobacterium columnare]|uniref:Cytosine-specific methyltransferase n=1 Tax=Flavobacterium columnare TaxID=996 RepID=A0AA94F1J8_9FLAO|nr:DNA cytosine methyltransferase [Flavobacterium columnare]MCH4829438.1 DNA cytosine methyltransferase [Flavobacterium columnare]MCH4829771.1 DNA cytosine methyltransferase [Flavobacterium columnare]MCH4831131.1 DNA cytosine methyltransferase [Flavobacterium columnare]MCH4831250.1 DNA cytosine methyltransferase [Flavobacterium columnare]MCH4831568.1 DNA cytosine methyltransferase [Flavobacterium columnare]